MTLFDFESMSEDEKRRLAIERFSGASGAGQSTANPKAKRNYRKTSYSEDLEMVKSIYKNLGVRAPTNKQLESGAIRRGLGPIQSTAGLSDVLSYAAQGDSPIGRFRDTIRYMRKVAENEDARLRLESRTNIDLNSLSEISGRRFLRDELSDNINAVSPRIMDRENKKARVSEIRGFKSFSDLRGLYSYFNDYAAVAPGGIADAAAAFTPAFIAEQKSPEIGRGKYAGLKGSQLQTLTRLGDIGAARKLFVNNVPTEHAPEFERIASKIRSISAIGALDQMVANGATPDSYSHDPKAQQYIRTIDQIEQRQQSSSLIEQFASYFNYMTTQGMRRGTFRFVAQEIAPAVRATMAAQGLGLGGALLANTPLLAAAGVAGVVGAGVSVSNMVAQSNLARLTMGPQAGTSFGGLDLIGSSFMVGQSPTAFLQSMRMLALTESPNMSTKDRSTLAGKISSATGLPAPNAAQVLNRLATLGASESDQRGLANAMMGGLGGAPAQSQFMLDFYTKLGLAPSLSDLEKGSSALHANPLTGSFLPAISNAMTNANSAFSIAMLTGKRPQDLYTDPLEMGKSLLGLFSKGGMFDLGPDITPLIAAQFGLSPQDIARLQGPGGAEMVAGLASAQSTLAGPAISAQRGQAAAASGLNPLARLANINTGTSGQKFLEAYAEQRMDVDPTSYTALPYDPVTNQLLSRESPEDIVSSVQTLQSQGVTAEQLGLGKDQEVVDLLRQIRDIEQGSNRAPVLSIASTQGVTGRATVSSPTSTPTPTPLGSQVSR